MSGGATTLRRAASAPAAGTAAGAAVGAAVGAAAGAAVGAAVGDQRDPPWGRTRWGRPRWGPVSRRRRWRRSQLVQLVAVALVAVAVWLTVSALLPAPVDPGVPTVVSVHDVALGSTLTAADLRVERRQADERPAGALDDVRGGVGQVVSGPVLAGEIVTSARFRGASQLAGLAPGFVAVSLPVADSVLLGTLRPADTVSVLAAGTGQPLAVVARVLSTELPVSGVLAAGASGQGRLVVAVTADEAGALAVAMGPAGAPGGFLVAVRG
jgi:Flp pilus assembly protein CpaB